jgi:hypothetical protein
MHFVIYIRYLALLGWRSVGSFDGHGGWMGQQGIKAEFLRRRATWKIEKEMGE